MASQISTERMRPIRRRNALCKEVRDLSNISVICELTARSTHGSPFFLLRFMEKLAYCPDLSIAELEHSIASSVQELRDT